MGKNTGALMWLLAGLLAVAVVVSGCGSPGSVTPPSGIPSPAELSATLVPNLDLDAYIYLKQERPTTVTGDLIRLSGNVDVVALSAWGLVTGETYTFGLGLLMSTPEEAKKVHDAITPSASSWKMLSGNMVYYVAGTGGGFESLKNAIANNNFKYFDDKKFLEAVASLPGGGNARLAGVALAKPRGELVKLLARGNRDDDFGGILTLARLEVVVAGLYSPQQIDLVKVQQALSTGNLQSLDASAVFMLKSGLPGLLVEPMARRAITGAEFTEARLGELTVYQRNLALGGNTVPVLVRLEGNRIFAATSAQRAYAESLISGIK